MHTQRQNLVISKVVLVAKYCSGSLRTLYLNVIVRRQLILSGSFWVGFYCCFKVAEHSLGSLRVYVICQTMARKRLQGSKFKFEFGSTCATRCKFLGAELKILGEQLIMLGASISKEKVKSLTVPRFFDIFSLLLLLQSCD